MARRHAVAVPIASGACVGGDFGSLSCLTSVMVKPAARIASSVDRLQLQPCPHDPANAVEPVLPARQSRAFCAQMLDEEESAVGLEHAAKLSECSGLSLDRTEDERRRD